MTTMRTKTDRTKLQGRDGPGPEPKALYWALAIFLAGIVLLFDPWALDAYDLPKTAWLRIGSVLLLGLAVRHGLRWGRRPLDFPVLAWLAVTALFTVSSIHSHTSFFGRPAHYVWGWWTLLALALVYGVVSRLPREQAVRWLLRACLAAGVGALAAGALTEGSTIGMLLHYGGLLAMLIPVWLAGLFRAKAWLPRLGWVVLIGLTVAALLSSLARSAWLGAIFSTGLWLLLNRSEWSRKGIAIGVLLAAVAAGLWGWNEPAIRTRMGVFLDPAESSASARLGLWETSLDVIEHQKGWGAGLDGFGWVSPRFETEKFRIGAGKLLIASNTHNELLQVAATMGVLGLLAYLLLWGSVLWTSAGAFREAPREERLLLTAFLAAGVALWVHSQFNFATVSTAALLWASWGCLAARPGAEPRADRPSRLALGAILLAFAAASLVMLRHWRADRAAYQGLVDMKNNRLEEAVEQNEKAYRLNPWGRHYAMRLSLACRRLGNRFQGKEKGVELGARSVEVNRAHAERFPLDPEGQHNYAMALMWPVRGPKHPNLPLALEASRKAVALAPRMSETRLGLGEIMHFSGDVEGAKKVWIEAMTLNPGLEKVNAWLEKYAPRRPFMVSPHDLKIGALEPGALTDLREEGRPRIKIVNAGEKTLRFRVEPIQLHETLYKPPEGYLMAPPESYLEPETRAFELGANEVRPLSLNIQLPERARRYGDRFCFLVRIRCTSFDIPVDRVVRVLATVEEDR